MKITLQYGHYDACLGVAGQVAGVPLHEERLHGVEDAAVHI